MQFKKNMQGLFAILFLYFATSLCFCARITAQANPSFNVVNYGAIGNGQTDDSQAFLKAWRDVCNTAPGNPTLIISKGKTFMLQPVVFQGPCKPSAINIMIEGTIIAPNNVNAWKWPSSDRDSWIQFSKIKGLDIKGSGTIDGQGAPWWDCFAKSKCKRPKALGLYNCENLKLSELTVTNSPIGHIGINSCNGLRISHLSLVSPKDSPNTDGIDVSNSSNVAIEESTMKVGDDCIAINKGSSFMNITGIFCGPGHGISIGSLGKGGTFAAVEEIHVRNCTFTRSTNGARIKTWEGGSGYARKITFEDIILVEAQNPVIINQHYIDSSSFAMDDGKAVKVSDITYRNFQGTSAVEKAIQLLCDKVVACTNIVLDQIRITSFVPRREVTASCLNVHGTSSSSNVPKISCLL